AHITTFGEKVIDTFYVTDLTGQKIDSPTRMAAIRNRLVAVLEGTVPERGGKAKAAAEAEGTAHQRAGSDRRELFDKAHASGD
ncbi:MAG: hypothetical protein E5V24_31780, partial [Mesorhizobium sp.]